MSESLNDRVVAKLEDGLLRKNLRKATGHSIALRNKVVEEIPEWEELRESARRIKEDVIHHLPDYLRRTEERLRANGVKVLYAEDAAAACRQVLAIARDKGAKLAVKSKSMATEEIGLAHAMEAEGIRAVETDLGEYIVQIAGEMPSHITAPAIHKSREQIGRLFQEKLGVPYTPDPEELTAIARKTLRQEFLKADLGITGANFLIAETGTLVIIENEGNIGLTTTVPKTHIAVVGIEKIIPKMADLPLFLKILPRSATGQRFTSYVSIINSPRKAGESAGPDELFVIFLDNGRSRIRRDPNLREMLSCIKCGACLNTCPVYQNIGGHAYGGVYPGPIGSLLTPGLQGFQKSGNLPFLSTLCGSCSDVCPVKIDIHRLLLYLRDAWVREKRAPLIERILLRFWFHVVTREGVYTLFSGLARLMMRLFPITSIGGRRIDLPPRRFRDLWNETL
ncbi:MAG: iron-sulfur cluster-binding protein [Planctomycetes bacterium RBG_16_59_8]|nr:MAG: iron-sulfur cluster-binding protein [Planctomycetes bacterium RBG_16_59_8]